VERENAWEKMNVLSLDLRTVTESVVSSRLQELSIGSEASFTKVAVVVDTVSWWPIVNYGRVVDPG